MMILNHALLLFTAVSAGAGALEDHPQSHWIERLTSVDGDTRLAAMDALTESGPNALNALVNLLKHENPKVRSSALVIIGRIGLQAKPAVPALVMLLSDQQSGLRCAAADALGKIGVGARAAEPALREMLRDPDSFARASSAEALGKVRAENHETVAALVRILQDRSAFVAVQAARSLGILGAKSAVSHLVTIVGDQKRDVLTRTAAAQALGAIGPPARLALPTLIRLLKDKNAPYRDGGGLKIDPDKHQVEIKSLADVAFGLPLHRAYAAEAIARIDPGSTQVAEALTAVLQDHSDSICSRAAAGALSRLGPNARPAVDYLAGQLRGPEPSARRYAAARLGEIGAPALPAIPALIKTLREAPRVANSADLEIAIEQIGRANPHAVVEELIDSWKKSGPSRRVASLLGNLGPAARTALPSLRQPVDADEFFLSFTVERAIDQIEFFNPGDPRTETLRYLRRSNGQFVPETTISFCHRGGGSRHFIVSRTDRDSEQLQIITRLHSPTGLMDTAVTSWRGNSRKSASAKVTTDIQLANHLAQVTLADMTVRELICPDEIIVTSAPDWTDAVLLVRRYDRKKRGPQEFPGLWIHPVREPLRIQFHIERVGKNEVSHDGSTVSLDRFTIVLRNDNQYIAWGDQNGRLVRLIPKRRPTGGIVLAAWESIWSIGM